MGTEPVLDQTAIGTVRGLIGYGRGKEARASHPGTQTDAAPAAYTYAECAAL